MLVALSSGLIIVFHLQGASSRNLGRNGSKERAVHHLLQRLLLLRFWMDSCNTMKQMTELRNMSAAASWVTRLAGLAARSGPIASLRESACMEAVSANFLTAVEL